MKDLGRDEAAEDTGVSVVEQEFEMEGHAYIDEGVENCERAKANAHFLYFEHPLPVFLAYGAGLWDNHAAQGGMWWNFRVADYAVKLLGYKRHRLRCILRASPLIVQSSWALNVSSLNM